MGARERPPGGGAARRAAAALGLVLGMLPVAVPNPAAAVPGSNNDIYVEDSTGGTRRALVTGAGDDASPSWSPNGSLAFDSNRDGDYDIYLLSPDGRTLTYFDSFGTDIDPAYSPDGHRIAFSSDRIGPRDIWVMNEDGTGLRAATSNGHDSHPAWSPDGSRIAFTRQDANGLNIWVVGADGSGLTQLSHNHNDGAPSWSPDGRSIAFDSAASAVKVMNADGSAVRTITQGGEPVWTLGGTRIVYVHIDAKATYADRLWAVSPDGSNNGPLGDQTGDALRPAWNAATGQIAFTYHP